MAGTTPLVELYENNAGGLYLRRDDSDMAHAGIEFVPDARFDSDAAELAAGDVPRWITVPVPSVELEPVHGTRLVATWDAGRTAYIVRPHQMGTAARRYLGLEA